MRYRPRASRAYLQRWMPDGATVAALATAPMVVFDRDDELQDDYLRQFSPGHGLFRPPRHLVPATADFLTAICLGYGWGMLPDLQVGPNVHDLVELTQGGYVDVVLHWQQWKLRSPALDRVAAAVVAAAHATLRQRG